MPITAFARQELEERTMLRKFVLEYCTCTVQRALDMILCTPVMYIVLALVEEQLCASGTNQWGSAIAPRKSLHCCPFRSVISRE